MRRIPTIAVLCLASLSGGATAQGLDPTLSGAAAAIMNANPVLGGFIVGLTFALWWRERFHEGRLTALQATHAATLKDISERHDKALEREMLAHQETREMHLKDIKEYATIGETVRDQMRAMVDITKTAVELLKERARS